MCAYRTQFCAGFVFWAVAVPGYRAFAGPGVYMLCRREPNGLTTILYVGEAGSISERLGPSHEHWQEALSLGMNEVHVHLLARTELQRREAERAILAIYATPLNRRQPPGGGAFFDAPWPTSSGLGAFAEETVRAETSLTRQPSWLRLGLTEAPTEPEPVGVLSHFGRNALGR